MEGCFNFYVTNNYVIKSCNNLNLHTALCLLDNIST